MRVSVQGRHTARAECPNVRVRYQAGPGCWVVRGAVRGAGECITTQSGHGRYLTLSTSTSTLCDTMMASGTEQGMKLPPEIWTQIFSLLGVKDLCNVLLVSSAQFICDMNI